MICPHCGKQLTDSAQYCVQCGNPVGGQQPTGDTVAVSLEPTTSGEVPASGDAAAAGEAVAQPLEPAAAVPAAAPAPEAAAPTPEAAASTQTASAPEAAASAQAAPAPAPQPEPQAAVGAEPQPTAGPTPHGAPVPPPPVQPQPTVVPPQPTVQYKDGCLASAWRDIRYSEGWFGRMMLLGLINCVPILNFFVTGYCMRWSRQLPLDQVQPMPKTIFGERCFVNGFFAFVIALVIGVVNGVCSGILGFIPILGALVSIVLGLFLSLFEALSVMRCAVADNLGAGFDIPQIWDLMKKNFGALLCAVIVPALILTAVVVVISIFLSLIMVVPVAMNIESIAYSAYWGSSEIGAMISLLGALMPFMIVSYLIGMFLSAFYSLLMYRAVGHYIARYQG